MRPEMRKCRLPNTHSAFGDYSLGNTSRCVDECSATLARRPCAKRRGRVRANNARRPDGEGRRENHRPPGRREHADGSHARTGLPAVRDRTLLGRAAGRHPARERRGALLRPGPGRGLPRPADRRDPGPGANRQVRAGPRPAGGPRGRRVGLRGPGGTGEEGRTRGGGTGDHHPRLRPDVSLARRGPVRLQGAARPGEQVRLRAGQAAPPRQRAAGRPSPAAPDLGRVQTHRDHGQAEDTHELPGTAAVVRRAVPGVRAAPAPVLRWGVTCRGR